MRRFWRLVCWLTDHRWRWPRDFDIDVCVTCHRRRDHVVGTKRLR